MLIGFLWVKMLKLNVDWLSMVKTPKLSVDWLLDIINQHWIYCCSLQSIMEDQTLLEALNDFEDNLPLSEIADPLKC